MKCMIVLLLVSAASAGEPRVKSVIDSSLAEEATAKTKKATTTSVSVGSGGELKQENFVRTEEDHEYEQHVEQNLLQKKEDPTLKELNKIDQGASSGEPGDRPLQIPNPFEPAGEVMKVKDTLAGIAGTVNKAAEWLEPKLPTAEKGSSYKKVENAKEGTMDYIKNLADTIMPTNGGAKESDDQDA